jgi:hypothetical protein
LNASEAAPNPFDFCPVYGPGDEIGLKHGAATLGRTRLHLGTGARVQRVLNRALTGQPVTISILGGSGELLLLLCSVGWPRGFTIPGARLWTRYTSE